MLKIKAFLESSFAEIPFENSISQYEVNIQEIGILKRKSGTMSDGMH